MQLSNVITFEALEWLNNKPIESLFRSFIPTNLSSTSLIRTWNFDRIKQTAQNYHSR